MIVQTPGSYESVELETWISPVLGITGRREGLLITTGKAGSLDSWGQRMESQGTQNSGFEGMSASGGLWKDLALTFV